jgi:hypothetical protein
MILLPDHILGHNVTNIHNTPILVSNKKVNLDGEIEDKEWNDASKINFSSPGESKGYILIFLKYDIFEKALYGAFIIPDKTPFIYINNTDQIGFAFDITHSKNKVLQSTDQQIVFTRGERGEYYLGDNKSRENQGYVKSIYNITAPHHTIPTIKPLSNVTFYTIPNRMNNTIWQGEFKINFSDDPKVYGFAINSKDVFTNNTNNLNYAFINYPGQNYTQIQNPSSWGDIIFPNISYLHNIHNFCGNNDFNISQTNEPIVLCGKANPLLIDDKSKNDIVVSGYLGNILNNSHIEGKKIITYITDTEGNLIAGRSNMNEIEGVFSYSFSDINLKTGLYKIWLIAPSEKVQMNFDLKVNPHILTIDEFFAQMGVYIALIGGLIGFAAYVPKIRSFFYSKQQRINTTEQLDRINKIFDEINSKNIESGLDRLKDKRDMILWMLKRGNITEGQFVILNQKISDYIDKLQKY